jgi:hypothetical protein
MYTSLILLSRIYWISEEQNKLFKGCSKQRTHRRPPFVTHLVVCFSNIRGQFLNAPFLAPRHNFPFHSSHYIIWGGEGDKNTPRLIRQHHIGVHSFQLKFRKKISGGGGGRELVIFAVIPLNVVLQTPTARW